MWRRRFTILIMLTFAVVAIVGIYSVVAATQEASARYERARQSNVELSRTVQKQQKIIERQQMQINLLTEALHMEGIDPPGCAPRDCKAKP
jgi:hypothetical protein